MGHGLPLVASHAHCNYRKTKKLLTLPVDQVRVRDHPGFQHPPELDVTLGGGQQLVVLVAAWDVHLDLPVRWDGGVLVYALVFGLNVSLQRGKR